MTLEIVLLLQLASSLPLAGLIWTVQLVVYPQFAAVGATDFRLYHERHMSRISFIVGPLIAVEAVSAGLLAAMAPAGIAVWLPAVGLALVVVNLAATAFVLVPLHQRLTRGRDADAIRRLVATNWIRTAAWTARAVVVVLLIRS